MNCASGSARTLSKAAEEHEAARGKAEFLALAEISSADDKPRAVGNVAEIALRMVEAVEHGADVDLTAVARPEDDVAIFAVRRKRDAHRHAEFDRQAFAAASTRLVSRSSTRSLAPEIFLPGVAKSFAPRLGNGEPGNASWVRPLVGSNQRAVTGAENFPRSTVTMTASGQ